MDELLDSVVTAVLNQSSKDGCSRMASRMDMGRENRSKQETAFVRFRRKILDSVENRLSQFQDPLKSKQENGQSGCSSTSSSRRGSSSSNSSTNAYSTRHKKLVPGLIRSRSETKDLTEMDKKNTSSSSAKAQISTKHEWIATIKEMADPNNEMSSSGICDLSGLNVQTIAIPDDPVPSCSYDVKRNDHQEHQAGEETPAGQQKGRSVSFSGTGVRETVSDEEASCRPKRRRKRRRSRSKNLRQVMYQCPKCDSSYLAKWTTSSDNLRCLYCDYWTSVEPEFVKDEKMEQNFCKIS